MHGMLEMFHDSPNTNTLLDDRAITDGWQAYKQVNRAFRDKVSIPYSIFHTGPYHATLLRHFIGQGMYSGMLWLTWSGLNGWGRPPSKLSAP